MKSYIVIPARYESSRFPGKPLQTILGIPMIVRVWRQCLQVAGVDDVIVATDHEAIRHLILDEGGKAVMTDGSHESGTDRVAEVAKQWDDNSLILNVQGDLPFVHPQVCQDLLHHLHSCSRADITTPAVGQTTFADFDNPNTVKVVFDLNFKALYFSRKELSYLKEDQRAFGPLWYRHIGVYAYRNRTLQQLANSAPTLLEQQERLEQLRAMEFGYHIRIVPVLHDCGPDINCPEDLGRIN